MVQWLRLQAPNAGGLGSILARELDSMCSNLRKVPGAAAKTWHSQIKKFWNKKVELGQEGCYQSAACCLSKPLKESRRDPYRMLSSLEFDRQGRLRAHCPCRVKWLSQTWDSDQHLAILMRPDQQDLLLKPGALDSSTDKWIINWGVVWLCGGREKMRRWLSVWVKLE